MNVNDPSWKYGMFILFLLLLGPIGVLAWFFIDVLGQRLSRSWMVRLGVAGVVPQHRRLGGVLHFHPQPGIEDGVTAGKHSAHTADS